MIQIIPHIEIDPGSGFCFGVTSAIQKAEECLRQSDRLYCLGDIVHNSDEVERLRKKGLVTISHQDLAQLRCTRVLLRAHGEPPSTYQMAQSNDIDIIDATCPVVLKLQQRIKHTCQSQPQTQIVIYGKLGHAEVNGLVGQTDGKALVVNDNTPLTDIDFSRPIALYSQTTQSLEGYKHMYNKLKRMCPYGHVTFHDTICRQVANRADRLRQFAQCHSVVLFVSGRKSSNGRVLYQHCLQANPRTHPISNPSDLQPQWFDEAISIGICGATSTPRWLMEDVKNAILNG